MKIICSWCKKLLGEKEPSDDPSEIHAKCAACIEKQKHQEQFQKKTESGQIITLENGSQGYISMAGKESPKLSFGEIDFSGKVFFAWDKKRKEFEKHLETLSMDEVNVTWLHSAEFHIDKPLKRRGRKKEKEEPPPQVEGPKEDIIWNCTVRVSKDTALQIFDSSIQHNRRYMELLADMTHNWLERETIPVDSEIFLFPPQEADIPRFVEFLREREIYERTIAIPYPYTDADGKKFIELVDEKRKEFGHSMDWGIRNTKAELIGMIGFQGKSKKDSGKEEVGFWLGKPYWGKGIMTKVIKKLTEHAFREFKYQRIEINIFSFNDASCCVAEKCGYRFEKLVPEAYQKDGKAIDAKLYAIETIDVQLT